MKKRILSVMLTLCMLLLVLPLTPVMAATAKPWNTESG